MNIFNFKSKKQTQPIETIYEGHMSHDIDTLLEDAKSSGSVVGISKKIFKKFKELLKSKRNYEMVSPPVELETINQAFRVEGFLRRSRDRYVELIWKNGFKFRSTNKKAKDYIERRFNEIALVTDTPTEELFDEIAAHLVLYYNCFLVKIRNDKASTGTLRTTFYGKKLKPIAGYFVVEPFRMLARRDDKTDKLAFWEHFNDKNEVLGRYTPEDVVHFKMNKDQHEIFATPAVANVLDDIRALRRMEENVEILVFQHAIPLYHYKVGTKEDGPKKGEVESVEAKINNMATQGMFVTDGRHDIEAVGLRGATLDIDKYLNHFIQRILVGIGQSASSIGLGEVSRSSMGQVSKMVLDAAARFQRRIKSNVELFMIDELLDEGGFNYVDEKDWVEFFIPEIDLDDRIRREFHASSMWQANLLTEDEARAEIGRDPYTDEEFTRTYFARITIPKIEIEGQIKAAASVSAEGERIGAPGGKAAEQKALPRNQYGTKRISGTPKRGVDSISIDEVRDFVTNYRTALYDLFAVSTEEINDILNDDTIDRTPYAAVLNVSGDISINKTAELIIESFKKGIDKSETTADITVFYDELKALQSYNSTALDTIFNDIDFQMNQHTGIDPMIIFDGFNFKIELLSTFIIMKAYNMGLSVGNGVEKPAFDDIEPKTFSAIYGIR